MTPAARLSGAIDLLCAIQNAPRRPADAVANTFFRERRYIGGGDRRAISTLVWDVLRAWRRLHWHLRRASGEERGDLSPRLLCASMMIFSGVPPQSVRSFFSAERYAPSPLTKREDMILSALDGAELSVAEQNRAVRLEYPDWIGPRLLESFGPRLEEEMAAMLEPAPLDLRVNQLKATRDEAMKALRQEGFLPVETPLSPWGLRLDGRQPVTACQVFRDGVVEIQDEGSQLIAAAVGAQPVHRVLDYCAGAAGKTLALAMTMENRGQLVACDVSPKRLEGAVKRLRRAGVHNVSRHLLVEGDKWAKRRGGSFDRVLVDAPCSGTGTWRRNPDARLRLTQADLDELVAKQRAILDRASTLVKPGGRLIYATCSVLSDENNGQIEAFLARNPLFAKLDPSELPEILPPVLRREAHFALSPHREGTDGFFVCVMTRHSG